MSNVEFTDNSAEILAMLEKASAAALEIVGGKVESWAKGLCAPKGPNGNPMRGAAELRNSISHQVENGEVSVGSSMQIAPYIELGNMDEAISNRYQAIVRVQGLRLPLFTVTHAN